MACRTFLPAGRPICAKASTGLRVPVMGQSFGGWNSLALATMAPPPSQRRGQLCRRHSHQRMQSGGQGHVRCDGHIRPRRARALALVLWRTRQPILGTSLAYRLRALHPRRRQSRTCRFWRYGRCSQPLGHAGRIDRWVPKLDAYLAARGLPHLAIYPEYMPPPRPPTTNYAALDFMVSPHLAGAALPGRDLSRPFPACP